MTNVTTPLLLFDVFVAVEHTVPQPRCQGFLSLACFVRENTGNEVYCIRTFYWDLTLHVFWGGAGEL